MVNTRWIGDVEVGCIGLGCMPLSIEGRPDVTDGINLIRAALDHGVRLLDTADSYGLHIWDMGHNERLICKALSGLSYRDEVLVATKGGHYRPGDGSWQVNGRPEYLRATCEASARALGVEAIDLYYLHTPDPTVPYEDSIGALAEMQRRGTIRMVGVSDANSNLIDRALAILGDSLVAVQNQYSPLVRDSEPEISHCAELGLAFLPWSPLGGIGRASQLGELCPAFAAIAAQHAVSVHQLALAWLLRKGDHVIPIPGARRIRSIEDSLRASDLQLDEADLQALTEGTIER